ncbi:MAG: OsmC family protein, partial [Spirochaetales bacterium]|nr:OsmC family protein [Spirochaetales bacterium]
VLIFHSPVDNVVDISNAQQIYTSLRHPKSFVSLDRADHLLSNARDARHVGRVLAAWADSFLPAPSQEADGFVEPGEGWNVTGRIGRDRYKVTLSNGRHHQLADEPSDVGGGDLGGTPFDYLLWGLAACTVMTVRMYADRKEWPLEEVTTHLTYSKHAAEELGFPAEWARETRGQGMHIRVSLALRGALDDEQRTRLVEIAHRCPVHRTLVGPIKVSIEPA